MSARRILIISLLASLLGHLIAFTTFSVTRFKERERPRETTQVSFFGEMLGAPSPVKIDALAQESLPELQPLVKEELKEGPVLSLRKPPPLLPTPQIPLEEIISFLKEEEISLLQVVIGDEKKQKMDKERDE